MNTVEEWSSRFDLEYDNITSGRAPGLEPLEKSMFLTQAQDNVVIGLYKGDIGESFESTEELTAYLGTLIEQTEGSLVPSTQPIHKVISNKSSVYEFGTSSEVLFVTMETCLIETPDGDETITIDNQVKTCKTVDVVPITQDEFWRTKRNPFKKQNGNKVLRLSYSGSTSTASDLTEKRYSELISDKPILKYTVRYIKRPSPIVLANISPYKINGVYSATTCMLPKAIHNIILAEAVRLAKAVWNS